MNFIIMTSAQADAVRGETTRGHVLVPFELKDGNFVLPSDCLIDPAHASKAATLNARTKRDVVESEFKFVDLRGK